MFTATVKVTGCVAVAVAPEEATVNQPPPCAKTVCVPTVNVWLVGFATCTVWDAGLLLPLATNTRPAGAITGSAPAFAGKMVNATSTDCGEFAAPEAVKSTRPK